MKKAEKCAKISHKIDKVKLLAITTGRLVEY